MSPFESQCNTAFTSFVDGRSLPAQGQSIPLVDPATGKIWAYSHVDESAVELAVGSASDAYASAAWAELAPAERAALLRKLGDLIASHAEALGPLESLANGKSHAATAAEMRATSQWYHFYASALETHDDILRTVSRTMEAQVIREPLGVVVAITPFNGALSLGSWKLAPALAMGNAVILKPPAEAPGSSIMLAELALQAGFPKGIVNVVIGDAVVSETLATHPKVAMVSFTGSTATARILGAKVAGGMKRFVCEAGGKSAHIVFEDADLGSAVIAATQGAFSATGQTCVAGSRVLVHASLYDAFVERYIASARRIRIGHPASARSHIGPVASRRQYDRINAYIAEAVAAGGRVVLGGAGPSMDPELAEGFWIEPTIIVDVTSDMRVCREEIFGPVVTVQSFQTEDEAIAIANGVEYGLAAGFWTKDLRRARRVSRRLQAGTVWVNTYRAINLRVPFGGFKQSGIGRENGLEALDEFSQIKAVVTDYGPAADPFAH
ncbi:aldehyde dehydrogenase family protein [Microvirga mediterraneensis]|uniref:Aldehyde dehydrogenase family protein n=1 Tax=Microvirga mediterraneensis TaxID=2754695 RepID=A0A838BLP2_9HYPH|nr:aldehyde dehydrogenase family protein [Microvirga mediterraneensis]MBA1155406.1 aldehyde dehydrogenase family protein [Microvirga mediterraneensis]